MGEQEETKEDSKEEKAADSFVNDISEAEGRQEPTVEKEEEQEETKEDSKEDKAIDSFVNDVSEAEGRQQPTAESEKEEDQEETKQSTYSTESEKGIFKLKKDLEKEDEDKHETDNS